MTSNASNKSAAQNNANPTESPAPTAAAETVSTPASAPEPSKETTKAKSPEPIKASLRIDGVILPATIFVPDSVAQRKELLDLGAAEELSEAELALAEKYAPPTYGELTKANAAERAIRIAEQREKMAAVEFATQAISKAVSETSVKTDTAEDF